MSSNLPVLETPPATRPQPSLPTISPWLHCVKPDPTARIRLYAFAFAGGGASVFYPWSKLVGDGVELWAIRLPGRETRLREAPITSFSEMMTELRCEVSPRLKAPYAFFGHSLGALLAYALAQSQDQSGSSEPRAVIVAGARAPHLPISEPRMQNLTDGAFLTLLRERYNGIPPAVLAHPELLQLMLPTLRADIALYENYQHQPAPPLRCTVAAFGGDRDPLVSASDLSAWQSLAGANFTTRQFAGDHFFLQQVTAETVAAVRSVLDAHS